MSFSVAIVDTCDGLSTIPAISAESVGKMININ
jgi:hypothetical protein